MNRLPLILGIILLYSCNQTPNESTTDNSQQKIFTEIEEGTIINLYDSFGENKDDLVKDFGFSAIMKFNGKTILFDAGTNAETFKKNVDAMNIDLRTVDFAVASHSHFDHINGFDYLLEVNPQVKIYFPFDFFWGANIPFDLSGMDTTAVNSLPEKMQYFNGDNAKYTFNQSGRFWRANVEYIHQSQEIEPGVKLITSSSPFMGYFTKYPNMNLSTEGITHDSDKSEKARFIELPELSLSLTTNSGEVIVVGCSHSTVEKIIANTKSYTNNEIALVYGGYHLLPYESDVLGDLAHRLKNEAGVKKVAPAHCTGHLAFKILQDYFQEDYLFAGLGEVIKIN